mmetsp:Transcript_8578/g.11608  ORF Transcript_8578/g.11608 Transcript_8578/m.11608 type:complete len:479 (-) Transcript_8578:108-1544(-)
MGKGGKDSVELFSSADVAKHNTINDCWLIVNGKVYDVTDFIARHPGGDIIMKYAGNDATDVFTAYHNPREFKRLPPMMVGELTQESQPELSENMKDYRALNTQLWESGWMEADPMFFVRLFVIILFFLAVAVCLFSTASSASLDLYHWSARASLVFLGGVCLAQFWHQSLLMAHDACHNGITKSRKVDSWLGAVLGTLGAGIGASWWTLDHNEHHVATNQLFQDPSAGMLPFASIHEMQLPNPKSKEDKLPYWFWANVRTQHWQFVPLVMLMSRLNLQLLSLPAAPTRFGMLRDCTLMAGHVVSTYAIVSLAPPGFRFLAFFTAYLGVSLLHFVLSANHYSMPMIEEIPAASEGGWMKMHLETTLNIRTGWFLNWYLGGLNYQVEHHLFPQLPRSRLSKLQPRILELCEKHGLQYHDAGLIESVWLMLKTLARVANSPELEGKPGSSQPAAKMNELDFDQQIWKTIGSNRSVLSLFNN